MAAASPPTELPGVPPIARPLFEDLLLEPLRPVSDLKRDVRAYWDRVRDEALFGGMVDGQTGSALARACLDLLASVDEDAPDDVRHLVQAAVRYFVIDDDGAPDLHSMEGFVDDVGVLNAVVHRLGRDDLRIG